MRMDKSCQTCANYTDTCRKCVTSGTFSEYTPLGPVIKDSGERREFETGAVRDIQEGKGRCDLLPLMQVAETIGMIGEPNEVIQAISLYQTDGGVEFLKKAITDFLEEIGWTIPHAMLEVSKHFEAGCQKYGERNWEKGIPEHCYIDSAIRHYLKWRDGWTDEPHDRAVLWNLICLWWTHENITEVDDERVDV
jgi:hypothetical protein